MGRRAILIALLSCSFALGIADAEPCRTANRCSEARAPELHVAMLGRHRERPGDSRLASQIVAAAEADERSDEGKIEMPWIWKQLRRTAYHHLPRKRVDRFDASLAPTVVSSGFDTVPGAGLQGRF